MTDSALDPIPQVIADDPHDVYPELRDHHPLHYVEERDLWIVSRYQDIQQMVKDPETWTSQQGVTPNRYQPDKAVMITGAVDNGPGCQVVFLDGELELLSQDRTLLESAQPWLENGKGEYERSVASDVAPLMARTLVASALRADRENSKREAQRLRRRAARIERELSIL